MKDYIYLQSFTYTYECHVVRHLLDNENIIYYIKNETLIDLTKTPDRLKEKILNEFNSQDPWHNKGLVFPYLINKNMKMLIESVEEFI